MVTTLLVILLLIGLYLILYHVGWHVIACVALVRLLFSEVKVWEVNEKNPQTQNKYGKMGVLRKVEPITLLMMERGGEFMFPVIQRSAAGITVRGLQEGEFGVLSGDERDWDVLLRQKNMRPLIQSAIGYWDPIYFFRKGVDYLTNGRQAVRVYFPWFVSGWREMYEPRLAKFLRARSKGKELRPGMELYGKKPGEQDDDNDLAVHMVADSTDHADAIFQIRFLSESFPVEGIPFIGDVTCTFEVLNLDRLFKYRDWSEQILASVSDAIAKYFRAGKLDTVYSTVEQSDELQKLILKHLTNPKVKTMSRGYELKRSDDGGVNVSAKPKALSVTQTLGLDLQLVVLRDIEPANKVAANKVIEVMGILPEGQRKAEAAGMMASKTIEPIKKLAGKPDLLDALPKQTAAQNLAAAKNVDWLQVATSGAKGGDTSSLADAMSVAMLQALRQFAKEKDTSNDADGGEK